MLIVNHWFERGGSHLAVVLKRGPVWTSVLECGTLHARNISSRDLDKHSREVDVNPRKLAIRLEKKRNHYKRLGMFGTRFTDKPTRKAIKLLRASIEEEAK